MSAIEKAAQVRLIGFDVDGILTDGRLYFSPRGDEMKAFFTRDGLGIKLLQRAGIKVAIITGRDSEIVSRRAANLGIQLVRQNVDDKRKAMAELLAQEGLDFAHAAYMGDDVVDVSVMKACAFSATVPDGHFTARRVADYVAEAGAGRGAVREACEFILRAQGKLDDVFSGYLA
jgi:3-deoxy-D-manno-octulosonate 8-phosphate phosphatase (KDO 8-P phosphatase)